MVDTIRTPTHVSGPVTPEEEEKMRAHNKLWVSRALRTDPINPEKISEAIKNMYTVLGLKAPIVAIARSPLEMAFAYGAAAAILHKRKNNEKIEKPGELKSTKNKEFTVNVEAKEHISKIVKEAVGD